MENGLLLGFVNFKNCNEHDIYMLYFTLRCYLFCYVI